MCAMCVMIIASGAKYTTASLFSLSLKFRGVNLLIPIKHLLQLEWSASIRVERFN